MYKHANRFASLFLHSFSSFSCVLYISLWTTKMEKHLCIKDLKEKEMEEKYARPLFHLCEILLLF